MESFYVESHINGGMLSLILDVCITMKKFIRVNTIIVDYSFFFDAVSKQGFLSMCSW